MKQIVSLNNLVKKIQATEGKIFRATFFKKNGEVRDMTARFGVTDKLKGGELSFNPEEKRLLIVYDMQKEDYRAISIDGLISAHIDETEYVCKEMLNKIK